jgi:hypothetical protein
MLRSHRPRGAGPPRACARRSLGKEERCRKQLKTIRRDPVGQRAHPVESGQHPEASLASWQATARAKRRQRVSRAGPSSPEIRSLRGSPRRPRMRGPRLPSRTGLGERSRRGLRSRRGHLGVPQEPGRPVCSRRPFGCSGRPILNGPGPCGCQRAAQGANSSLAHGGRPSANPMSLGRWAGRSRKAS